ncbi:MAG: acetyl-CoA decarbonylase/synthase complex subunit gamma [Candidatus Altarchaeaceae archaeon]
MARPTALQIFKYLKGVDPKKYGFESNMDLAIKLASREKKLSDFKDKLGLQEKIYDELNEILTPPVREINLKNYVIGGEEVLNRHELRFYNETAFFVDISDNYSKEEILRRINFAKNLKVERIGKFLKLQGIALRCESNDKDKFVEFLKFVKENGIDDLNLILCSFNPEILKAGVEILKSDYPLIYGATKENFNDVFAIALKNDLPLAICGNINDVGTMVRKAETKKFQKLVIDTGIITLKNFLTEAPNIRRAAINNIPELRYPTMISTLPVWTENKIESLFKESALIAIALDRFVSLIIFHSTELTFLLPNLYLRLNIYTDPRVSPTVEAKLYALNNPDEYSPVFVTTNFALTYFAVTGDIGKPAWLVVVDTEGLAVLVSVAAAKFTGEKIAEKLKETKIAEKVKHRALILPGLAAGIAGQTEEATGWKVFVGPKDSGEINSFIEKTWIPYIEEFKKGKK